MTPPGSNATADFLRALSRDIGPLRESLTELDGLWGKGIGNADVDREVLATLKRKVGSGRAVLRSLEKLAAGEVPE